MSNLPLFGTNHVEMHHEFQPDATVVLYPGDVNDLLPTIPDSTIKLIVTSPPYNIGKAYETRTAISDYLAQQEATIKELYRVLREDGSICWQVGNYVEDGEIYPLDIFFYDIFKRLGMQLRNRIVWHFGHGLHASKRFSGRYETLLWFTKSDKHTFNLDDVRVPSKYPGKRHFKGERKGEPSGNLRGKNPSDVWEFLVEEWETALWDIPNCKANHPEKTIHPAQFPIELVERCVLAFTEPGDWVLDPYSGVGSTIIGAVKQERKAIGAEREEAYLRVARERVQDYYGGTLRIRPLGTPVFIPSGSEQVAKIPQEWLQLSQGEAGTMRIVGAYSFKGGKEIMEERYPNELAEIYRVLQSVNASEFKTKQSREKTTMGEIYYSPSALNNAIKAAFQTFGWKPVRVACDYPTQYYADDYHPPAHVGRGAFREMDFVKHRVGVEVQFGKYSFMVYNVAAKMTIFHKLGHIDVGVEIVPVKEMATEMSSGVSYFEQFLWDLDQRGTADIDIPVLILGIAPTPEDATFVPNDARALAEELNEEFEAPDDPRQAGLFG